jgi:hypothetical protein
MDRSAGWQGEERLVRVPAGRVTLEGNLSLPEGARGVVLFAHGSGSSRHSSRNRYVARLLNEAKLATLLVDLLTAEEEAVDLRTAHLRFDIGLLLSASSGPPTGSPNIRTQGISGSATSAPAPAPPPRWSRRRGAPRRSARSSRAAGAPISPGRRCRSSGRRRC